MIIASSNQAAYVSQRSEQTWKRLCGSL